MPFREGHIYPLRDPGRFVEALGEISHHRRTTLLAIPLELPASAFTHALLAYYGPIPADAATHDAFITTDKGDVHPNMDKPISIHLDDVILEDGRLLRLD
ncbi:hypothetical protein KNJ79_09515 [Sphingopyxis indica]|uniref:hypothetical protein n=1 Tax=Sphingopyxis indica TaxID=436663 RepID=UPI0029390D64|nr:hypothetical protein [Sphingopyxis indica]WOF45083.1 hypothetical protein KNJ79_09515 [Sphingopyxis indica]